MAGDLLPNLVGLGMLGGGALFCGWFGMRRLGQSRLMTDTPTSRIRSAAQGFVELQGVLVPTADGQMEGPLTGQPCLWWSYRIEQYTSNGKKGSWKTIESGSSERYMVLRDETGDCLISPAGAEVHPASREVWRGSQRHPRQQPAQPGVLGWLMTAGGRYRYTEERLHAGETLYALGDFRTSGGGREGLDVAQGRLAVIREWKQDFQGLLARFDQDGNGQLDEQEWERVRQAAEREARHRHAGQSRSSPKMNLLARPRQEYPFILSSHGESELAGRLRNQALGLMLMCLLLTGVLVWSVLRLQLLA